MLRKADPTSQSVLLALGIVLGLDQAAYELVVERLRLGVTGVAAPVLVGVELVWVARQVAVVRLVGDAIGVCIWRGYGLARVAAPVRVLVALVWVGLFGAVVLAIDHAVIVVVWVAAVSLPVAIKV